MVSPVRDPPLQRHGPVCPSDIDFGGVRKEIQVEIRQLSHWIRVIGELTLSEHNTGPTNTKCGVTNMIKMLPIARQYRLSRDVHWTGKLDLGVERGGEGDFEQCSSQSLTPRARMVRSRRDRLERTGTVPIWDWTFAGQRGHLVRSSGG